MPANPPPNQPPKDFTETKIVAVNETNPIVLPAGSSYEFRKIAGDPIVVLDDDGVVGEVSESGLAVEAQTDLKIKGNGKIIFSRAEEDATPAPLVLDDSEDEVDATPAAVEAADESDVDLSEVEGSGKDGRVTKADVEAAADED